jgi:ADP-ribose pyrophosphatase YjhB (NUDIX family)
MVLLQRRRDSGNWSLPGGVLDIGETISECCVREVLEETGLNVEVVRIIGIYSDPRHVIEYADGEIRQQFSICFECRIKSGNVHLTNNDEVTELQWFPTSSLPKDLHPAQLIRIQDWINSLEPVLR